jgi:hypothetical protein
VLEGLVRPAGVDVVDALLVAADVAAHVAADHVAIRPRLGMAVGRGTV